MDVDAVIRELAVGILRHHKVCFYSWGLCLLISDPRLLAQHNPISKNEFLKKWKNAVGDTFESSVKLSLLSVRCFGTSCFNYVT